MKKRLTLLSVVGIALLTVAGCGTASKEPNTHNNHTTDSSVKKSKSHKNVGAVNQASNIILSIHMFSSEKGWLLTKKELYHTIDGGNTWTLVTIPSYSGQVGEIVATSGNSVWITELSKSGISKIFTSRDGGVKWKGGGTTPKGTVLVTATEIYGWVRTSRSIGSHSITRVALYRSDNNGQRWSKIPVNGTEDALQSLELGKVTFVNKDQGFVFGQSPIEGSALLFGTTDGGRKWSQIRLPIPRDQVHATITVMRPLLLGDAGVLLVYFSKSNGETAEIYQSKDRGHSWVASGTELSFKGNPYGFVGNCVSDTDCEVVGNNGSRLFLSHNGGKTWSATKLPAAMKNVRQIDFVSKNLGWADSLHHLWRTTDGGKNWDEVTIKGI